MNSTTFGLAFETASSNNKVRQTVLINLEGKVWAWTRQTDTEGVARGEANAWVEGKPHNADLEALTKAPIALQWDVNPDVAKDSTDLTEFGSPRTFLTRVKNNFKSSQNTFGFGTFDSMWNEALEVVSNNGDVRQFALNYQPPATAPIAPSVVKTPTAVDTSNAMSLTAMIPTMEHPKVKTYRERVFNGVPESSFFDSARNSQRNLAIWGEAGTGKTSAVYHYGALRQLPVLVVSCTSGFGEPELQGSVIPKVVNGEQTFEFVPSPFAQAIQQPCIILLNEFTRLGKDGYNLFMTVLEERFLVMSQHEGEVIHRHPECLIVADMNFGYRSTGTPDQATIDRFGVKMQFTYDRDIERNFIPSEALLDLAFDVRNKPEQFRNTPFSTRLLKDFVANARDLGIDNAIDICSNAFVDGIEREAIEGLFKARKHLIAQELVATK